MAKSNRKTARISRNIECKVKKHYHNNGLKTILL